jgi:hypothetical protein
MKCKFEDTCKVTEKCVMRMQFWNCLETDREESYGIRNYWKTIALYGKLVRNYWKTKYHCTVD